MNRKFLIVAVWMMATVAWVWSGCSGKKQEEQDHHDHSEAAVEESDDWKEMDDFHMIMAEAFHPFKDSANLEPAKKIAAEMAESASAWLEAPLPKRVDNDNIKTKLESLKSGTISFAEAVKTADDKTLGESLTQLHDQFHELQEAWYGGHGDHH